MNRTGDVAVDVTDVYKAFDRGRVPVLRGVNLTVERGELVAITGASGAGKSTLLHLIAALDVPDRGRIVVAGRDLAGPIDTNAYRREIIGLVFQLHDLLAHLDAAQNVELAMFGTHRNLTQRRNTARDLLAPSASPARNTGGHPSSRVASVNASPSPVRSPTIPPSCSPTNPPATSNPAPPRKCSACSSVSATNET